MKDDFGDLLALFLDEATARLERLARLAPTVGDDPEAAVSAQRELHALKGAARMMGFQEMAETCHRAEELAGRGGEKVDAPGLVALVDRLVSDVRRVAQEAGGPVEEASREDAPSRSPDEGTTLRAPQRTIDRVTDLATTMRILSHRLAGPVEDLRRLAGLAERGIKEEDPRQVLAALAATLRRGVDQLDGAQVQLRRAAREQVERLLELQMQPLEPTLLELARHARELARELNKEVKVTTEGGEVRLDRRIGTALFDSLLHLVRNAVDHGLETPEERTAAGKPPGGSLEITASQQGERVQVTVRDDGRGLDREAIARAAARNGADPELVQGLPAEQLVLMPGFTTRESVSQVSGRGIGLDAVASTVRALGGEVRLRSTQGRGLTVTLDLPAARRGRRVVVAAVQDLVFAIPVSRIRGYYVAEDVEPAGEAPAGGWSTARVADRLLPVVLFGGGGQDAGASRLFIEVAARDRSALVGVQAVRGVEEVLTRTLPARVRAGTLFDEAAVLGSGESVPVLTPGNLEAGGLAGAGRAGTASREARRLRILLVDDSPVTREMERRLLEDAGLFVEAVADASTALSRLATARFDCVVTDIEMPGMDGLELTRAIRASERLGELAVVLVSTRNSAADRMAGLEAGADAYIAKQEMKPGELARLVRRLAGGGV